MCRNFTYKVVGQLKAIKKNCCSKNTLTLRILKAEEMRISWKTTNKTDNRQVDLVEEKQQEDLERVDVTTSK
jgi:hypothetical protein